MLVTSTDVDKIMFRTYKKKYYIADDVDDFLEDVSYTLKTQESLLYKYRFGNTDDGEKTTAPDDDEPIISITVPLENTTDFPKYAEQSTPENIADNENAANAVDDASTAINAGIVDDEGNADSASIVDDAHDDTVPTMSRDEYRASTHDRVIDEDSGTSIIIMSTDEYPMSDDAPEPEASVIEEHVDETSTVDTENIVNNADGEHTVDIVDDADNVTTGDGEHDADIVDTDDNANDVDDGYNVDSVHDKHAVDDASADDTGEKRARFVVPSLGEAPVIHRVNPFL